MNEVQKSRYASVTVLWVRKNELIFEVVFCFQLFCEKRRGKLDNQAAALDHSIVTFKIGLNELQMKTGILDTVSSIKGKGYFYETLSK